MAHKLKMAIRPEELPRLPERFRKLSLAQVNARIEELKTSIGE